MSLGFLTPSGPGVFLAVPWKVQIPRKAPLHLATLAFTEAKRVGFHGRRTGTGRCLDEGVSVDGLDVSARALSAPAGPEFLKFPKLAEDRAVRSAATRLGAEAVPHAGSSGAEQCSAPPPIPASGYLHKDARLPGQRACFSFARPVSPLNTPNLCVRSLAGRK